MIIEALFLKHKIKSAHLAKALGVSGTLVYQWRTGARPVAVRHCHKIENITGGLITRKDLRPNDWYLIWPDLIDRE